ncbi:MAG: outer membrane beta-barrel protein [Psychroflexus halocasei]
MKSMYFFLLLLTISLPSLAQNKDEADNKVIDSLYREDQFYAGVAFNLMTEMPKGGNQSGFSGSFDLGFIRDFPLNKRRNLALGIGLGVSSSSFGHNILISENSDGQDIVQPIPQDIEYKNNRFSTHLVEMPIQLRWRSSTPEDYAFWRVYFGVKLGYIYYFKSKFEQDDLTIKQTQVNALNRFRTAGFFSFGYNIVNIQIQYDLNPLFSGKVSNDTNKIGIKPLRIGLIFYIL